MARSTTLQRLHDSGLKHCPKCDEVRPHDEFYLCKTGLDGYCKHCRRAASKGRRKSNPQAVKQEMSRWYKNQGYHWHLNWRENNRGKLRATYGRRRARLKNVGRGDDEAMNAFYRAVASADKIACYYCGKNVTKKNRHVDHIIPLSRGGSHSEHNLCCACRYCNQSKSAKMPGEFNGQGVLL